jgi:hypothetical protein
MNKHLRELWSVFVAGAHRPVNPRADIIAVVLGVVLLTAFYLYIWGSL